MPYHVCVVRQIITCPVFSLSSRLFHFRTVNVITSRVREKGIKHSVRSQDRPEVRIKQDARESDMFTVHFSHAKM